MTNRELLARRTTFEICVVVTILAGLWAYGWYSVTSAIFSDLAHYGIKYGDEAYGEIVTLTRRHILVVCVPIVVMPLASLVMWGRQVWCDVRAMKDKVSMMDAGSQ